MTSARKLDIGLFLAVAITACLFVVGWIHEREQRIRAEASQQANDKIIAADQVAIHSRDTAAAQSTAALAAQAAAIHTSQQAAQVIVRYLPAPAAAPGQPVVTPSIPTVERAQLPAALQAELPPAPSYGILTQDQLVNQAKQDLACDATGIQLSACQKDQVDLRGELSAETASAHRWEAAAKGGTKLQRFFHVAKLIGCAGAGAGIGALAGQKSPAIGAAVGAGAGVTACSLF